MSAVAGGVARDRVIADVLFWVQLVTALGFGLAQCLATLASTEGVSITWIVFWCAFVMVNLLLAIEAQRAQPGRIIRQTVVIYAAWAVACAINVAALPIAGAEWTRVDSVTTVIAGLGIVLAIALARARGLPLSDPMLRASFAVLAKAVPQLTLAWGIVLHGGEGLAAFTIVSGHLTINLRLWQVWYSIREAGWDRYRAGIAISEAANEASWIVVTIVWLIAG